MIERRKKEFLRALNSGLSIRNAARQTNPPCAERTYERWCDDPEFRAAKDSIMLQRRDLSAVKPTDFAAFRLKYFGHESPPVHLRIIDKIEGATDARIVLVLIPPEHGKTSLMCDWATWKLSLDPNHRILYVSESQKLAVKQLGRIKRRFTDPRVARSLIGEWGPYYREGQEREGRPWAASFFTVSQSDHDEADYSMEAVGWSSTIYGVRSDTIILDDFQTLNKTNQTDQMVETFQQDIITRCAHDGRIFIVGTRVAQRDFYIRLLEDGIVDDQIIFPAVDVHGEPLWPEQWPLEQLEQRKGKVGEAIWRRAYMMRPQDDGEAVFTETMLEQAKDDASDFMVVRPDEDVWAGYDPAPTNYSAITVAAVNDTTMRVLDVEHRSGLTDGVKHRAFIRDMWMRLPPGAKFTRLIIETNAFAKVWVRDTELRRMAVELGFTIQEHETGTNKSDLDFGVLRSAGSFVQGNIRLNWTEPARTRINQLIDEMLLWRPNIPTRLRTQDLVMSFWFVWNRWQRLVAAKQQPAHTLRAERLPFRPLDYKPGQFDRSHALGGRR